MAKKPEVAMKFTADSKKAEQGINKVTSQLNSFKKKLSSLGDSGTLGKLGSLGSAITGFGALFQGVTKAVGQTVAALNECVEAWKVQQNAERSLEAAARNNPFLNGQSVKGLKEFAGQLQSVSNFGDEELIPMMSQLAAAGRTQSEIMDIMSAAVDVAASGTMSLESAVKGLNQTYSGSAGSMAKTIPALKGLTEEQLKSGEAVKIVAQAYKGQAEATADAAVQMKNAWGDVKEAIGANWNDALAPAQKALAGFFGELATNLRKNYDDAKILKDALKQVKDLHMDSSEEEETYQSLLEKKEKLQSALPVLWEKHDKWLEQQKNAAAAQDMEWLGGDSDWWKGKEGREYSSIRKELEELEPRLKELNNAWGEQAGIAAKEAADAKRIREETEAAVAARKAAEEQARKESETRARLRTSYETSVDQVKKEIEARRQLGETVSQEEEDRAEYEARYKGYLNLIKSANGLISGNYETEVNYRKKIAELAEKIAKYDAAGGKGGEDAKKKLEDFQKAIADINKEFGKESPAKKESERILELKSNLAAMYTEMEALGGIPESQLKEAAESFGRAADELNEAYARAVEAETEATRNAVNGAKEKVHSAGSFTEREEKSKTPLQDAVAQRQEAMEAEMAALTKSVEWEQFTADQKKEIWDQYYSDLARMNEEMYDAWNMDSINSMESVSETVANATAKVSSALQSAGDNAIKKAEEQKNRELAILDEKYKAGELSEQEYQQKKTELEQEGAKKEYQIKNWQWAAQVAEATANIAVGVTKAIAENGWPAGAVMAAMAAAAGAIQLATVVSNKPQPPAFEKGGIVPGSSYSGDKVQIRANSGEGVFTRGQMKALGLMARGEDRKSGGTQVSVENNASNLVGVSPQVDGNKIKLLIDARVNESMRKGRYNGSLAQASDGMTGKFYGV